MLSLSPAAAAADLQVVSASIVVGSGGTSKAITIPAAQVNDVLLVIHASSGSGGVHNINPGWSLTPGTANNSATFSEYRICDGTEGTSLTVSWTSSEFSDAFIVYLLRGVDITVPPTSATVNVGTGNAPDTTALTIGWGATKKSLGITMLSMNGTSRVVAGYPSGWTLGQTTLTSSGSLGWVSCASIQQAASVDPPAWNLTGSSLTNDTSRTIAFQGMLPL